MITSSLDCNQWTRRCRIVGHKHEGPVVRRPISANPGLNFNLGFFFFCSKVFYRIIFSILFRASNHQIAGKKNKMNLLFKLSYLNSNFVLTMVILTLLWTTRPPGFQLSGLYASSETQGQSVGSGEKAGRKFSSTGKRAPGYRLSPNYSKNSSRCRLLIGHKNALYYCAQSANSFSRVLFVSSYTTDFFFWRRKQATTN